MASQTAAVVAAVAAVRRDDDPAVRARKERQKPVALRVAEASKRRAAPLFPRRGRVDVGELLRLCADVADECAESILGAGDLISRFGPSATGGPPEGCPNQGRAGGV